MVYHFRPIGVTVTKLMWFSQIEMTMTHAKFGVNMSKHCRDTASRVIFASWLNSVAVVYENCFVYQSEIHKYLSAWSEDDTDQFW